MIPNTINKSIAIGAKKNSKNQPHRFLLLTVKALYKGKAVINKILIRTSP